ncbi:MAG: hypothetical protein ABI851_15070 [Saprospiraceae bacterium]
MFSNLILGITVITYIFVIVLNAQTFEGNGESRMTAGMAGLTILSIYAVSSLLLTIVVTNNGGFNWISSSILWRNTGVCLLWLGMIAGVFLCTEFRTGSHFPNESTGVVRLLIWLQYYGGIWLPLLMLLPYASFLNPEWRFALAPNLFKIPLLLASAMGFIILVEQLIIVTIIEKTPKHKLNQTMTMVNNGEPLSKIFYILDIEKDERLSYSVFNKIKERKNWETELIESLENNQWFYNSIYDFLDSNEIEHTNRFIEPINHELDKKNRVLNGILQTSWKTVDDFESEKIECICRVLTKHFKESSATFRPNMLAIQKTLAATPINRNNEHERFMVSLNKYRLAVKNWLDTH